MTTKITGTLGQLKIHPQNPHYFTANGSPIILISSSDIYYDIFSPNYDFRKYLDTLAASEMNITRIYPAGCTAFVPQDDPNSILPWVKLENGKFDLDQWNPVYFTRLHDFFKYAQDRGIYVDVCMFNGFTSGWREPSHGWPLMPFNSANNIQGEGCSDMNLFTTLKVESNVKRQKAYIRKICQELNGYDNVIYDNIDEPDCMGSLPAAPAIAWVNMALDELRSANTAGHLIAQTHYPAPMIEAGGTDFCKDPRVSWISVEYDIGLRDFDSQYRINKPYVLIETYSPGRSPAWDGWFSNLTMVGDDVVSSERIHSWAFLVGGGSGYLGWSANYHPMTPAGVEPQSEVNRQKKVLKDFLYGFDFVKMNRFSDFSGAAKQPSNENTAWADAMAEAGQQYAFYLSHSQIATAHTYYTPVPGSYQETITFGDVPAGTYQTEWVSPQTGKTICSYDLVHQGGALDLKTPQFSIDIALRMKRV